MNPEDVNLVLSNLSERLNILEDNLTKKIDTLSSSVSKILELLEERGRVKKRQYSKELSLRMDMDEEKMYRKSLEIEEAKEKLSNQSLTGLPNELPSTTKLFLDHNLLTELSKTDFVKIRAQCGHLTLLSLQNNQLSTIAKEIQLLVNLTALFVQHNKLAELPSTIGKLTSLKTLHVEHNNVKQLPMTFSELVSLEKLG